MKRSIDDYTDLFFFISRSPESFLIILLARVMPFP